MNAEATANWNDSSDVAYYYMDVQAVMSVNEVRNERENIKILAYCLLCSGRLQFP